MGYHDKDQRAEVIDQRPKIKPSLYSESRLPSSLSKQR